jgi:hypothetical protein
MKESRKKIPGNFMTVGIADIHVISLNVASEKTHNLNQKNMEIVKSGSEKMHLAVLKMQSI